MYSFSEGELKRLKEIILTKRGTRDLYKILNKTNKVDIIAFNKLLRQSSIKDRKNLCLYLDNPYMISQNYFVSILTLNFVSLLYDYFILETLKRRTLYISDTEILANPDMINKCCQSFIELMASRYDLETLMEVLFDKYFDNFSWEVKSTIMRVHIQDKENRKYNV